MKLALPALRLPRPEARHWLCSFVLATMIGLYALAGLSVTTQPSGIAGARAAAAVPSRPMTPPPQPEPLQFREVAPQDAVAINAAVPLSTLPNPAARAYVVRFASDADRLRAVECLTAAVYYEAAVEPLEGQRAVAQVVLNRARHPAYPSSVCGVVFQGHERATGCQFTFTCDGSLARAPVPSIWARAKKVAEEALAGKVYAPVGWATHYHTNWVVPYWSSSLTKLANVGTHIFYRWEGGWGRPGAFARAGSGSEPQFALMRRLTSDPASLAAAEELAPEPVDEAAAAAALAAAKAGTLTADQTLPKTGIDSFQRAVLRRYEPMTKEAATAAAASRAKQPLSEATHWALSGVPKPAAAAPDARKDAETPAKPACLEGVRRAGDKEAQSC